MLIRRYETISNPVESQSTQANLCVTSCGRHRGRVDLQHVRSQEDRGLPDHLVEDSLIQGRIHLLSNPSTRSWTGSRPADSADPERAHNHARARLLLSDMDPQATQQRQQLLTAGSALDNVLTQMNQRLDALEKVADANSAGIQQISLNVQAMNANLERVLANMQNTEEQLGRVRRSWNYKVEQTRTAGRSSVVDSVMEHYRVSKGR